MPQASPFLDALVFSKVKKRLGGRIRVIISGAAPLPRHIEECLMTAMCAPMVQVGVDATGVGTL